MSWKKKSNKLRDFLYGKEVTSDNLLVAQLNVMDKYLYILEKRIEEFEK